MLIECPSSRPEVHAGQHGDFAGLKADLAPLLQLIVVPRQSPRAWQIVKRSGAGLCRHAGSARSELGMFGSKVRLAALRDLIGGEFASVNAVIETSASRFVLKITRWFGQLALSGLNSASQPVSARRVSTIRRSSGQSCAYIRRRTARHFP